MNTEIAKVINTNLYRILKEELKSEPENGLYKADIKLLDDTKICINLYGCGAATDCKLTIDFKNCKLSIDGDMDDTFDSQDKEDLARKWITDEIESIVFYNNKYDEPNNAKLTYVYHNYKELRLAMENFDFNVFENIDLSRVFVFH